MVLGGAVDFAVFVVTKWKEMAHLILHMLFLLINNIKLLWRWDCSYLEMRLCKEIEYSKPFLSAVPVMLNSGEVNLLCHLFEYCVVSDLHVSVW